MTTTVALLDFNGLWWRNWHARGDEAVNNTRTGVVGQVISLATDYDHLAICVDSPKLKRRDKYPEYKANREPHDALALEQMRRTLDQLRSLGFPMLQAEGHEADDVIATCAAELSTDHDVTIISGDKDLLQCLGSNVSRLNVSKDPPILAGSTVLKSELGITPEQMPEWLALVGDSSDNIPGVHRCGPKTASKWLGTFGSIESIVTAAANGDERLTATQCGAILEADQRSGCTLWQALELATLKTDLEIDTSVIFAERRPAALPLDNEDNLDMETPEAEAEQPTQPSQRPECECEQQVIDVQPVSAPDAPTVAPAPPPPPRAATRTAVALTQVEAQWERELEPSNLTEAKQLAKHVIDSRLFTAFGTPQAVLLVIMAGRELGLGAMASLRSFHIVEGRPEPSAQLLMAICLRSPACKEFSIIDDSKDCAVVQTQRVDWPKAKRWTFDAQDAEDAGLLHKKNWKQYRRDMLLNRCIARAARFTCPEQVANLYDPEELES